ncbi:transglutaminase [Leifsonia sp. Leaf325]|nr:transglutaminase family protein [Leifsonia sp. Leaf325]KQQ93872.1 transglutaminase [Leifsonia sp. Leaf325]
MQRKANAHLRLQILDPAHLAFIVAAAEGNERTETLELKLDGSPVEAREVISGHGTRIHALEAGPGELTLDYAVTVTGQAEPLAVTERSLLTYLRPSRYCESDSLGPTAVAQFGGLTGVDALDAVSSWVGSHLAYVPGSSLPTDGAERTLLARQGVCRDYAHLVIAFLRALDIPARLVAVYAPGLDPMDFHAVAEAYVDGAWHVVDATALAPRQSLVRIATGRDAADTAFLSTYRGAVTLEEIWVSAVVDELPHDDVRQLVQLR